MSIVEPMSSPEGADRIKAIRAGISDDAETGATFGEGIRARVAELNDRVVTDMRSDDLDECGVLLSHVRDRVSGLDPARLEPRGGLAGLFDSRGKRLKAFRLAYRSTADAAASAASELMERAAAVDRRSATLDGLWTDLRDAVADLDAHVAAGRSWLADRTVVPADPLPPEAAAAFEDTPALADDAARDTSDEGAVEAEADAEAVETSPPVEAVETAEPVADPTPAPVEAEQIASVTTLPHPLEARLEALSALRSTAISRLPLIRATQNADVDTPTALRAAREQIEGWSADWREALGLSGKRPKKVRPDGARLLASREALEAALSAAERSVASAAARRAELAPRVRPMLDQAVAA